MLRRILSYAKIRVIQRNCSLDRGFFAELVVGRCIDDIFDLSEVEFLWWKHIHINERILFFFLCQYSILLSLCSKTISFYYEFKTTNDLWILG